MPTYRNLSVSLVSQFDILTIPEYAPPPPKPPTSPPSTHAQARPTHDVDSNTAASVVGLEDPFTTPDSNSNQSTSSTIRLVDPARSLVSVYIPTYPSSQFWLSYAIAPPHPPGLLYYFKLLINGSVVVSWGVGKDDGWKGKTMFALCPADTRRFVGKAGGRGGGSSSSSSNWRSKKEHCNALLESRTLCFASSTRAVDESRQKGWMPEHLRDVMEIRVYRSKGRVRIAPELGDFDKSPVTGRAKGKKGQRNGGSGYRATRPSGGSIELVNAGPVSSEHPKRFYKYALLDPLDRPFVTFRYFSRTWENLEELGVISPPSSSRASFSDKEPNESTETGGSGEDVGAPDPPNTPNNSAGLSPPLETDSSVTEPRPFAHELDTILIEDRANNNAETSPEDCSQSRPSTPPPSLEGIPKIRFVPTAAGLVTTNTHYAEASLPKRLPPPPLRHQTSREDFAALVRSQVSKPDPISFSPTEMRAASRPSSPFPTADTTRTDPVTRSGNGNLFKTVLENAFAKQKRPGSAASSVSAASDKSASGRRSAGSNDRSMSASPAATGSEDLSVHGGSNGRSSRQGKGKGRGELQKKERAIFRTWARGKKGNERALHLEEEEEEV